jgi:hypothetical protein
MMEDVATLGERVEADAADRATWADVAVCPLFSLVDKFNIVNTSLRAEPLGKCGLTPQVPYEISILEQYGPSRMCTLEGPTSKLFLAL